MLHGSASYLVFMDDDDYLGPRYLEEHLLHAKRGRFVGKRIAWVEWEGDSIELVGGSKGATWLLAGTMGGFVGDWELVSWPEGPGEEVGVACQARELGLELHATSVHNFVYRRGEREHGYQVTREKFYQRHGKLVRCARSLEETNQP